MSNFKAVETVYKGYRFRSRLEARWAIFFDSLGIKWEYEPEGIVLSNGKSYLPDFYLINCYFEVKRKGLKDTKEGQEAIAKISDGMDQDTWAGIIAFGDPVDDDLMIFCQETDDGGGGSYESEVTIGLSPWSFRPHLFSYNDRRERSFYTSFDEEAESIPMNTTEYGNYAFDDFVTQRVVNARLLARQARFEHGETIKARAIVSDDRENVSITASIAEMAENPYIIFEQYIGYDSDDTIPFYKIDNGVIPPPEYGIDEILDNGSTERFRACPIVVFGGGYVRQGGQWVACGSRYDYDVRSQNYEDTDTIVENNFRVLLTRARKEMIILIPNDSVLDETYQYFVDMGMDIL